MQGAWLLGKAAGRQGLGSAVAAQPLPLGGSTFRGRAAPHRQAAGWRPLPPPGRAALSAAIFAAAVAAKMEAPPVTMMPVTGGTINMMEYLLQGMARCRHPAADRRPREAPGGHRGRARDSAASVGPRRARGRRGAGVGGRGASAGRGRREQRLSRV